MSDLLNVALFELTKRKRRIATYVHALSFFATGVLWIAVSGGFFSSASVMMGGKVLINGPQALASTMALLGYLSVIVMASVMGQAVYQDFDHGVSSLLYTTRVSKSGYYFGRFAGAFAYLVAMYALLVLGLIAGTYLPGMEPSRLTSTNLTWFVQPFLIFIVWNLVALGPIFFVGAALTRRILPVYTASIVLFLGYSIAKSLTNDLDDKLWAALFDPFGMTAISVETQYRTVVEKNTEAISLVGKVLYNRLLWLAVGVTTLVIGFLRFRLDESAKQRSAKGTAKKSTNEAKTSNTPTSPTPTLSFGISPKQVLAASWLEAKQAFRNIYFLMIVLAGVLTVVSSARMIGKMWGTTTYPVTGMVLQVITGIFGTFIFILLVFYTGELVWRDRQSRTDQIMDALPVPTWFAPISKALALVWMIFALEAVVMVLGVSIQLAYGFTAIDVPHYLIELFVVNATGAIPFVGLTLVFHALSDQKFKGHIALVSFFILQGLLDKLGLEHDLFSYAGSPIPAYSDMNGYGPYVQTLFWFNAFWCAVAITLLCIAVAMWPRGTETSFRLRIARARLAMAGKLRIATVLSTVTAALLAGFILYNTNYLNAYRSEEEEHARAAHFERTYKPRESIPRPTITDVELDVAMYPSERRATMKGTYKLVNTGTTPISDIDVNVDERALVDQLELSAKFKRSINDRDQGYYVLTLEEPLAPRESVTLSFALTHEARGFGNSDQREFLAKNGMFLGQGFTPGIGYSESSEMQDDDARRKQGLAEKARMRDLDDPKGLEIPYVTGADWVTIKTHVSTSADQIPLAPGDAVKEWVADGRRHIDYQVQGKGLFFTTFLSAAYAKRESKVGDIDVTIFYHPTHTYALDRMERGAKAALDYCQKYFGPYQHRQVRIVEFPRYQTFAQSFPSTIPFSEAIGFIAKVDDSDPKSIDYPFYISVHEIAHQWWAHQVVAGSTQGATVLSETLAQYTSLMAMKHAFGEDNIGRYLRHELEDYLQGRGGERKKEVPLLRVENQPYIHYNKGSLVMYETQELLGEEVVNRAIQRMLNKWKFSGPPYPNARALYDELRAEATPEQQAKLADAFEHITLYDNRAIEAQAVPKDDGYDVTLKVSSRRYHSGELGEETDQPLDRTIEVGVKDADGKWLLIDKPRITQSETALTLHVKGKPSEAAIDPRHLLIDRRPEDNTTTIKFD